MKKITILLFIVFLALTNAGMVAQINVLEKVKQKTKERADERTGQGVDKGLDKVEGEVIDVFEKKDGEEAEEENDEDSQEEEKSAEDPTDDPAPQEKKEKSIKIYSKFDFIPGTEVIFFDDFEFDGAGNFPAQWNTNATGEIVVSDDLPGKWFLIRRAGGNIFPEFKGELTDNFTIEFDITPVAFEEEAGSGEIIYTVYSEEVFDLNAYGAPGQAGFEVGLGLEGSHSYSNYTATDGYIVNNSSSTKPMQLNQTHHVSIWAQVPRVRVYIDETKVIDVPKGLPQGFTYNRFRFITTNTAYDVLIDNFRIAVGTPDTRNQLLKDGRLVTRGILFASGSDVIRAESYGVVKEISTVLKENPSLNVKIIGHTDSDGSEESNLSLSKRRAESVKKMLNAEFGIETARLSADGKGESVPESPNTTPEGKANNRRVEFVRI